MLPIPSYLEEGSLSDVLLPPLSPARAELIFNFDGKASWGIRDPARFQALLAEAKSLVEPGYYLGDNLFTWGAQQLLSR